MCSRKALDCFKTNKRVGVCTIESGAARLGELGILGGEEEDRKRSPPGNNGWSRARSDAEPLAN